MKIKFRDDYKGEKLETQIGNERFEFTNGGTPFDVSPEVGAYLLRLDCFEECPAEPAAEEIAPTPKPTAPLKKG